MYNCLVCERVFKLKKDLVRHVQSVHDNMKYHCPTCNEEFTRRDSLKKHQDKHVKKRKDDSQPSTSGIKTDPQPSTKKQKTVHNAPSTSTSSRTALERHVEEIELDSGDSPLDTLMESQRQIILNQVQRGLREKKGIKWFITVNVKFVRSLSWTKNETREADAYFQSGTFTAIPSTDVDSDITKAYDMLLDSLLEWIREGSGWRYECVLFSRLTLNTYQPLRASSYIPTPVKLSTKKAIINVQNSDNKCLLWSVLAYLHPANRDSERVTKYLQYEQELNAEGIQFPTPLDQVPKFARNNNLSISVYGFDKFIGVHPLLISESECERHVDLMLISDDKTQHFTYVKSMGRLLNCITKHHEKKYFCRFCLCHFSREDILSKHLKLCKNHVAQKTEFPEEGKNILSFNEIRKQVPLPFVIYSDWECFNVRVQGPMPEKSHTTTLSILEPASFCLVVICPNGAFFQAPIIYRGPNPVDKFFEELLDIQTVLTPLMNEVRPIVMTSDDEIHFQNATQCHICEREFLPSDVKVRDHCHFTSKYRSAAHEACNLEYRTPDFIPVVMHNMRAFDSHILMEGIGKIKQQEITCIANNMSKYISFSLTSKTKVSLRFLDSLQFMNASLDTLVKNVAEIGQDAFKCLKQQFPADKVPLLLKKGVFPYSYLDSARRFEEKELPPISAFYNDLTESELSPLEYQHAVNVWNFFELTNFGEYHDLYLLLDTILLADVFENFRDLCQEHYKLEPLFFFGCAGLAWSAALRKTQVELELFTDSDMYLFVEEGIRGGVSQISHRFATANNMYLDTYKESEKSSYISYIDCNNLYGTVMSQSLPTGGFKWVQEPQKIDVTQIPDDAPIGYILEVSLKYPKSLHDKHNLFPLAPEKMTISEKMLSPYSRDLLKALSMEHYGKVPKLVLNLNDKQNYILHYKNLKLYLSLGMELITVHRALEFKQSAWLEPYITLNTNLRKSATNSFQKDFFKLMSNSVFGKSIEDVRKRLDIRLVHKRRTLIKLVAKPTFKTSRIFSEDLVGVHMRQPTLKLDKPIFLGFSILDLSKNLMYDFYYNYLVKKYGSQMTLLFTDTDSFCFHVETDDIYKDMQKDSHLYDLSEFPTDHFLHSNVNKKALGRFKDEISDAVIREVVALRPKTYSILTTVSEKKTAKGVNRSAKGDLHHQKYKECLFNRKCMSAEMRGIVNDDHKLFTVQKRKLALSPTYDKRFVLSDGISTYAYGHFRIGEL